MKYAVVFERSPANYAAYVPDLPGCVATGRTRDEVEGGVREAIRMHVEALRAEHEPIPEPKTWTDLIEA